MSRKINVCGDLQKQNKHVVPLSLWSVCEASVSLTSGQVVSASEKPEADITVTRPVTLSARPSVHPEHQNSYSTQVPAELQN